VNVDLLDRGAGEMVIRAALAGTLDQRVRELTGEIEYPEFRDRYLPFLFGTMVVLLERRFPRGYDVRDVTRLALAAAPRLAGLDTGEDLPRTMERWFRQLLGEPEFEQPFEEERMLTLMPAMVDVLAQDERAEPGELVDAVMARLATVTWLSA
jgi:hypothetical protein